MADTKNIFHNVILSDFFNQEVLDYLPGVFYLYEIEGDSYTMKVWNKYHKELFGLTDEQCLDSTPFDYIDPKHWNIVIKVLKELVILGHIKQVIVNIINKNGESIPFLFEGYRIMINDKLYFTGLGLDISDVVNLKQELKTVNSEKEIILNEVAKKEKQLLSLAVEQSQNNNLLRTLSAKLDAIIQNKGTADVETEIRNLSKTLISKIKIKNNWSDFKKLFVNIHDDFFMQLKQKHPDLTESEIRYCSYIKINMSPNDICTALNISKNGLKKKRYRLNKKLGLNKGTNIDQYVLNSI